MHQHLETLFWSIKLVLNCIPSLAVKLDLVTEVVSENVNHASLEETRPIQVTEIRLTLQCALVL